MITLLLALTSVSGAQSLEGVSEDCYEEATKIQADIAAGRGSYNEQSQQDFLLNYFALATSFSPLHSAVPLEGGQGSIGLELDFIPSLGCNRRLVLSGEKTEDTNKAPIAPRPRVLFQFNDIGPIKPYAGLAYVPPVTVFGTRNVIISAEAGFGLQYDGGFEWGLRYHATLMKTVAEIATPFESDDPEELDFYVGSTFGVDAIIGYEVDEGLKPYVALGFLDASTFFYIGDDSVVGNNAEPYASFVGSLGAQYSLDRLEFAGEFYTAPGILYTGRVRMGIKL
jgi:hypothetical protein